MTWPRGCRYRTCVRNDWSYSGAFVLQLGPGTDIEAGKIEGRVEHIASTRSARFDSLDELLKILAEWLAYSPPFRPDSGSATKVE
jgi:hypothetical protein